MLFILRGNIPLERNLLSQNKRHEIDFFTNYANADQYNVFTDQANERIIDACIMHGRFQPGMLVVDIGCGSGVFTRVLSQKGFKALGVDMCQALVSSATKIPPVLQYIAADAECLPLTSQSIDAILLSGLIHHLPDPSACANEIYRVLKPGGVFAAFDPNRKNPFMWLYRDWQSPFYSREGVTENERPIIAEEAASIFVKAGFEVNTSYLSGLSYRYIASPLMRKALPLYNFLDWLIFQPKFMQPYSSFVITSGVKR